MPTEDPKTVSIWKASDRERKLRVFKFLHNANTKWSHVYHSIVCSFICTYALMQNFYLSFDEYKAYFELEKGKKLEPHFEREPDFFIVFVDMTTSCFLILEMCTRLWSSTYIVTYSNGWRGRLAYLKAYRHRRLLDLLGIFFYVFSTAVQLCSLEDKWRSTISVVQILQIWQANRILYPYLRVIFRTIFGYQGHYLLFCLFLIYMMITLSSSAIYLTEYNTQTTPIFNIFESFWFMFETFTTIGFGDIVPKHWFSKFVVCLFSVLGIFVFSLPSNIIGTTLSIKMNQDLRKSLKYRKAVRLIQTYWRCRISNLEGRQAREHSSMLWRALSSTNASGGVSMMSTCKVAGQHQPHWGEHDLCIIWFVMKTKYCMARYRFKRRNINLSSYTDVSQQNDEMWHRIDYIEKDLSLLSAAIYKQLNQHLEAMRTAISSTQQEIELLRRRTGVGPILQQ